MTIYIIETPHQGPAYCWTATDQREFINLADSGTSEGLPEDPTYDDAVAYLSEDLRGLSIFNSTDDAAAAYFSYPDPLLLARIHQNHFEITDAALHLRIIGALWTEARNSEREISGDAYVVVQDAALTMPETKIAEALGVDRMTVRRALGKR